MKKEMSAANGLLWVEASPQLGMAAAFACGAVRRSQSLEVNPECA